MLGVDVKDNFLSKESFRSLQEIMMGYEFPWHFTDKILEYQSHRSKLFQFYHTFYEYQIGPTDFYDIIKPCVDFLSVKNLLRVKANLNPRTVFHRKGGYHIDYRNHPPQMKTAILYLNTNNGWTQFKKGGKVKSVENRMVIFNGDMEHTGVTCTDEVRRVVINFNFI